MKLAWTMHRLRLFICVTFHVRPYFNELKWTTKLSEPHLQMSGSSSLYDGTSKPAAAQLKML